MTAHRCTGHPAPHPPIVWHDEPSCTLCPLCFALGMAAELREAADALARRVRLNAGRPAAGDLPDGWTRDAVGYLHEARGLLVHRIDRVCMPSRWEVFDLHRIVNHYDHADEAIDAAPADESPCEQT